MQNGHPVIQLKEKLGIYHTMVLSMQANQEMSELSIIVAQIMVESLWIISFYLVLILPTSLLEY